MADVRGSSNQVGGEVASGSTDAGNPVKIGGKATAAIPTSVSDGQRTDGFFDLNGRHVVTQKAGTATLTNVAGSASSVQLLAANNARLGATIYNDQSTVNNLYLKMGATASTSSFTVMLRPKAYYEVPFGYTGRIDGIWDSAAGNARITEF